MTSTRPQTCRVLAYSGSTWGCPRGDEPMIDSSAPISIREFLQTEGLEDWRATSDGALAFFRTASFTESVELVRALGDAIKANSHQPDIDIRSDGVTARLVTVHETLYGLTNGDVDLARKISAVAREQGLTSDPSVLQSVLIFPGAPNIAELVRC